MEEQVAPGLILNRTVYTNEVERTRWKEFNRH